MSNILLFDIETAPVIAYTWGLYNEVTSMKMVKSDWYCLCWGAKWLGDKKFMSAGLPDFKLYKKEPENDLEVMTALWQLVDKADILIAHNAIKFDIRKMNARFLQHNLSPPSPYKVVDTLKASRRFFKCTSNRLGDLGEFLGVGSKTPTGGFDLWKGCLAGDEKCWSHMVKYCLQDVRLLEKVYLKLRPYISNHPNVNTENTEDQACSKCGNQTFIKRGFAYTTAGKYQRYQCTKCLGWQKDSANLLKKEERSARARNIS